MTHKRRLTQKEVREALRDWLEYAACENPGHPLEDSRKHRKLLYLRPAINDELKSDQYFLKELASKHEDPRAFIRDVEGALIMHRDKYDYDSRPPILCEKCAEKARLEIHEDYGIATPAPMICSKCGKRWDPWADPAPGSYNIVNGEALCTSCLLWQRGDVNHAEQAKNMEKEQNKRKAREQSRREENDRIYDAWLMDHNCIVCGEDDPKKLHAVPGPDSPRGKPYTWKRDNAPDTFREKLRTTQVYCTTHKPD